MSHELLYVLDLSLTVSLFMLTFNLDYIASYIFLLRFNHDVNDSSTCLYW